MIDRAGLLRALGEDSTTYGEMARAYLDAADDAEAVGMEDAAIILAQMAESFEALELASANLAAIHSGQLRLSAAGEIGVFVALPVHAIEES